MSGKIQWDAPAIFATILSVLSIGAAAAVPMGFAETFFSAKYLGKLTPTSCSLMGIQCFSIGVLLACSVYNNFARSHLKFHGLGLFPLVALSYTVGFTENVIQNSIICAICLYMGIFYKTETGNQPVALKWNLATILMVANVAMLLGFCVSPFMFEFGSLFPHLNGQVSAVTFHYSTGMAFTFVCPMMAAVVNNRANQIQTWWAVCLLFNAATHMMMVPVDSQNAATNFILAVIHISSAFVCSAKTYKSRSE